MTWAAIPRPSRQPMESIAIAPGAGERRNQPRFRLRAGVVQTANGPYFLKLTGPQATVAKWNDAVDRFIASLRFVP